MKKKLPYYFILLLIPALALVLISNSDGANASLTGSPGDGVTHNCTVCHSGADTNTSFGLSSNITTNIPAGGYALGQTYTITITQAFSGSPTKHGFEITAENNVASKVGTFAITDAVNTQLKGTTNDYVTHTNAGSNLSTWSFNWTAPATDVNAITFYVASIAGIGGGTTDTQMALATKAIGGVLGVNQAQLLNFSMYPNPSDGQVTLQLPSDANQAKVNVFDYLGKTLLQKSINANNNTIDVSNLSTGIYFVRIQTDNKVGTKKLVVR